MFLIFSSKIPFSFLVLVISSCLFDISTSICSSVNFASISISGILSNLSLVFFKSSSTCERGFAVSSLELVALSIVSSVLFTSISFLEYSFNLVWNSSVFFSSLRTSSFLTRIFSSNNLICFFSNSILFLTSGISSSGLPISFSLPSVSLYLSLRKSLITLTFVSAISYFSIPNTSFNVSRRSSGSANSISFISSWGV